MADIVPNQWVPGGVMKQLGDAAGGVVYDQYAPGGCYRQLYTAAGVVDPPSQYAPGGPLGQVEAVLEAPVGGGGAPDWVPENAAIHIDLVGGSPQGRAWVDGTGEVAVDALLGSDPNTESGWGDTSYDPGSLQPYGYSSEFDPVALIGAARSMFFTGATVVIRFWAAAGTNSFEVLVPISADGNGIIDITAIPNAGTIDIVANWSDTIRTMTGALNYNPSGLALNCIAVTLIPARCDVAANGNTAVTDVLTEVLYPTSGPSALVAVFLATATNFLDSITFYDPLPTTTGLSELSDAGGVSGANTAPHDLGIVWSAGFEGGTVAVGSSSLNLAASGSVEIGVVFAADDEGNPLIFSVASFVCANADLTMGMTSINSLGRSLTILNPSGSNPAVISAGNYSAIVRTTDQGGLYVEQEFTLVVTA
jgi:hypothetical protein